MGAQGAVGAVGEMVSHPGMTRDVSPRVLIYMMGTRLGLSQGMNETSEQRLQADTQPETVSLHKNRGLPDRVPARTRFLTHPEPRGSTVCPVSTRQSQSPLCVQ